MLVMLSQSLHAQQSVTVSSIVVRGSVQFEEREILSWLQLKPGAEFMREVLANDQKTIQQHYALEGLLFVAVDTLVTTDEKARTVTVAFHLREGKPAILQTIAFEGNNAIDTDELLSGLSSHMNGRFRQSVLEQDLHFILKKYEQRGYSFAKVSIKNITLKENDAEYQVDALVTIDEGEPVRITELTIEGNTTTRDFVIEREARLRTNELFRPELAASIQQRLQRLQLFSSVSQPELYLREGAAGLLIRVTEGNPNRVDGLVGYVPSSVSGESGYFTGLANLQFRNLFGTGRRFSVRWHRENQSTQEIGLRYHEPWIASYPVNGEIGFFQRKQDSSYVKRNLNLQAEFMLSEEFRIGATFSQYNVVPSVSQTASLVSDSRTITIGGYLFYDSRDDAVTPTSGILYRTEFHTGTKRYLVAAGTVTNSTQRFGMDLEYDVSPFQRQVFAAGLHVQEFRSGSMEISDLFRLGGASTLRGYRESQFLGSRVAWANLEYRVLVSPRSFFFAFTDAAYVASPSQPASGIVQAELTKIGYGVGLRLDTAVGLLGVSVALGQGDTFGTAKLHVRLANEF